MGKEYEYKCTECALNIISTHYLEGNAREWGHMDSGVADKIDFADCGPLKRVWSGAFVWAQNQRGH